MGFWSLGFHGKSDITRAVRVMKPGKSPGVRMSSGCPVTQEKPTKTGAEKRQVDTISYIYILYMQKRYVMGDYVHKWLKIGLRTQNMDAVSEGGLYTPQFMAMQMMNQGMYPG